LSEVNTDNILTTVEMAPAGRFAAWILGVGVAGRGRDASPVGRRGPERATLQALPERWDGTDFRNRVPNRLDAQESA
jgi:hypothetical protein